MLKNILFILLLQITATHCVFADSITDLISVKTENNAVTTKKVIRTKSSVHDDKKIHTRLEHIFSELDALKNIGTPTSSVVEPKHYC